MHEGDTCAAYFSAHSKSDLLKTTIFNSLAFSITSNKGSLNFLGERQIQSQLPLKGLEPLVSILISIWWFKILNKSQNQITLKKDNIEISLVEGKFDDKKHTFKYVKNYPNQIALIDNKQYWGKDGGMPTTQFEKISIKTEQKNIILPKAALEGLYQPNISTAEVNYDIVNDTFFIQTMNSDGAGSYLVIWKVTNGIYIDRLVAYGF